MLYTCDRSRDWAGGWGGGGGAEIGENKEAESEFNGVGDTARREHREGDQGNQGNTEVDKRV